MNFVPCTTLPKANLAGANADNGTWSLTISIRHPTMLLRTPPTVFLMQLYRVPRLVFLDNLQNISLSLFQSRIKELLTS